MNSSDFSVRPNNNQQIPTDPPITSYKHSSLYKLFIAVIVIALITIISFIYFWMTKKQNTKTILNEPNPKIKILATLPPEDPHILYNIILDPYDNTLAYSINKNQDTASSSSTIEINGKIGKTYDQIDNLLVSPDGKRVAFVATKNKKVFVVVDGVEGKEYEFIKNLKFSPDSRHIAYCVGEGIYFYRDSQYSGADKAKTMFIVTDNIEGKKYEGTYAGANTTESYNPSFSRDGKEITYTAIKNGNNIIVVNNKEFSEFTDQNYSQFIDNSYNVVYFAQDNNKDFLVVAGEKKQPYDYISSILGGAIYLGKDASQIAYEATDNKISSVVVNGVSYPITTGVLQDFAFSGSGKYFAYYVGTWMRKDLYINGNLYGNVQPDATTLISSPLFSPNEKLLIYTETHQKEQNATIHIFSTDSFKKIIDFPLPGYKTIGLVKFSDDSKYIYFKAWHNRNIEFVTLNIEKLIKK